MPLRPDQLEGLGDQVLDLLARLADHLEREGDVLGDGLVGQQPEVLEDGADVAAQPRHLPAGEPVDLLAGDVDPARGGAVLPQHQAQEGRLAGARGADQEDELALLDVDRDVVEGGVGVAGVGLGDLLEANHGVEATSVVDADPKRARGAAGLRRRPCPPHDASGCRPP